MQISPLINSHTQDAVLSLFLLSVRFPISTIEPACSALEKRGGIGAGVSFFILFAIMNCNLNKSCKLRAAR